MLTQPTLATAVVQCVIVGLGCVVSTDSTYTDYCLWAQNTTHEYFTLLENPKTKRPKQITHNLTRRKNQAMQYA